MVTADHGVNRQIFGGTASETQNSRSVKKCNFT